MATRSYEFYAGWLRYNQLIVTVDDVEYKIHANRFTAVYPYTHKVVMVSAYPVDRESEEYQETKRELGDDWCVDVLGSSLELECKFQEACELALAS